jgi:hypothetical protein
VFGVFAMRELGAESFGADDELAWCLPESRPFQLRDLQESRAREPGAIHALGLEWFRSNVDEHRELGRRFKLHGVATWFHFHGGRQAARLMEQIWEKVRPIEKN